MNTTGPGKPRRLLYALGIGLCLAAPAAHAAAYQQLHAFGGGSNNDGAVPGASMIVMGGTLLGTTQYGNGPGPRCVQGGAGCGTVFAVTPLGKERVLYSFQGDVKTNPVDGYLPFASLLPASGALYGTTYYGGALGCLNKAGCGTVFKIAPDGTETVIHALNGTSDGYSPSGSLTAIGTTLYGTASSGGDGANGTVFSIAPDGTETVLHAFTGGADGSYPYTSLLNVGGTLYGTTNYGGDGKCNCGTVFSITPDGAENVIYRFTRTDGANPRGGLLKLGNNLYGAAYAGGASNLGTVFAITLDGQLTGTLSFDGTAGSHPTGGLVSLNGKLYGTTFQGGDPACLCGTVFSVAPGGAMTTIYSFQGGNDGYQPAAALVVLGNTLYGVTAYGGNGNGCFGVMGCGTVFAITP